MTVIATHLFIFEFLHTTPDSSYQMSMSFFFDVYGVCDTNHSQSLCSIAPSFLVCARLQTPKVFFPLHLGLSNC